MNAARHRRYLVTLVVWAGAWGCDAQGPVYAVGTLERDRIELTADSTEPVTAIDVTEGERVAAGTTLLIQDPERAEAQLAQVAAARDEAAARLEEAVAGPRAQEIAQAEARLAAAESAVVTARHELDRERELVARNFASQNRLDLLQGRYDEALARRREARAGLDVLQEGTRSEAVARAREALTAAEARVREVVLLLARTRVRAPVDGIVESLPLEVGERPAPGGTVVVLRALGPTFARVHIPEPLRVRLTVGASAEVLLDGREDPMPARLRWVSTEAAFTPYFALTQRDRSRLSYAAEVELTGSDADRLPVGIPVEVRFPGALP